MKLKSPTIRWKANSVIIFCEETKADSFDYDSLPNDDLVIPGFDCSEFNQMINKVRFDSSKPFVKEFKSRSQDPPGYQRCRALCLLETYPNSFIVTCRAFCILAYRYILNGMGSIKEIENVYKEVDKFEIDGDSDFHYRWITSVWTALAHSYVKAGNYKMAFSTFDKIHCYKTIKQWPSALVNIMGSCFVTDQSKEYSTGLYNDAIQNFNVKSEQNLAEIMVGTRILKAIMGDKNIRVPALYLTAKTGFSNRSF